MARVGVALVLGIGLCFCGVRPSLAQCSDPCRPQASARYPNGTTIRLAAGNGMGPHWATFMSAAGQWNTAFNSLGSSVEFADGPGDWTVHLDDTLPYYVAGEADFVTRTIRINSSKIPSLYSIGLHETGHVLHLENVGGEGCANQSVMFAQLEGNPGYVTPADICTLDHVYRIRDESPIVLNLEPGFPKLTDAEVFFDLANTGTPQLLGWTQANSREGFLVLDRNGDGMITSGAEMFGNYTPFPDDEIEWLPMNGFQALAAFDDPKFGGNNDSWITPRDGVFARLGLWIDDNHNGVSESSELLTLADLSIQAISLTPLETRRRDRYGNEMRYVAPFFMQGRAGATVMRLAVDVYFVSR